MRLNTIFVWSALYLVLCAKSVFAVVTPTFPHCSSPQGSVKATYSTGTHGIVGSTATYNGSDAVYRLTDDTLTQCFCSTDGKGIQTNWWKASSLSEDQIQLLKNEGWLYVPAGKLWGLEESPYIAKNIYYSCLPSSDPSTDRGGQVSGAATSTGQILGLATTGNILTIVAIFSIAFTFIFLGATRLIRSLHHEKNN